MLAQTTRTMKKDGISPQNFMSEMEKVSGHQYQHRTVIIPSTD